MKISVFFFCLLLTLVSHGLECAKGEYVVRGHFRRGYTRSDGTVVNSTTVKDHCKKLSRASEYFQKRIKSGLPPDWPHRIEKARQWSEPDKERIIEALETLPDVLLSDRIQGIHRLVKSKDDPNPASNADGVIVLYDSAFSNSFGFERILAHELSHQNYKDLSEKERQDYRRATGWYLDITKSGQIYWEGRKEGYVADDGRASHEEDYANNIEYFLYEPQKLKKLTPNAYEWIKRKYGDKMVLRGHKR